LDGQAARGRRTGQREAAVGVWLLAEDAVSVSTGFTCAQRVVSLIE
jgi:hypothetical protein